MTGKESMIKLWSLYNQSLEISEQSRDLDVIVSTLNNKANVHYRKGEYDKAIELYNQSLEISEKRLGYQYMVESTLNNIAAIHYIKGAYDKSYGAIQPKLGDSETDRRSGRDSTYFEQYIYDT